MAMQSRTSSRYANIDGPPPELYERLRSSMKDARASTFRTSNRVVAALVAVAVAAMAIVWIASELVYGRPAAGLELEVASTPRLLAVSIILGGLTLIATTIALKRSAKFGPRALWLALAAASTAPLYAVATLMLPVHAGVASQVGGVVISPWGLRCALIASLIGVCALFAFGAALRRAAPTTAVARGAALGAAAGAWAGLGVFLFCPSGSVQHVLAGHVSIIVLLTICGALFAARALRP
jgi:hypothetical protein